MSYEDGALNETERKYIQAIMNAIETIGEELREPVDPKVEGMLEITHALLSEQLALDKAYEWGPASQDDKFLHVDEDDILSIDELNDMFDSDSGEFGDL